MRKTVLFLLLLLPAAICADQTGSPQSAEYCGDCHRAVYDGWKHSAHASAMESRLFQDALKMAESDFGSEARKVCLRCHSPLGLSTGDLALVRKVTWEGVTCDYCHSIRDVTVSNTNPVAHVEFTGIKSGPYSDAVSPVHGTMFSRVHTTSLVCISCHEYRNSLGFPVLTTYSEWKDSPYAKAGQQCQSCHMYAVQGKVVDVRVTDTKESRINLHQMPGSRSVEQLNKAIRSQMSVVHDGDQLRVTVRLTNAGAGHYVPTGSPMRQLILEVRLDPYDGGQGAQQERIYARTIIDQNGAALQREHLSFLRGARVVKDTRLAPKETRTEDFAFALPSGKRARVEASLYYFYSPMATSEAEQKIRFVTMSRLIP
ncbi:MAG TPA: multiheme c-type cytochrome [Candidatus Methylomirabilis sp.]|nr:multiheme c-type cytochrome [Candidatus Methylomirabilis sp.]